MYLKILAIAILLAPCLSALAQEDAAPPRPPAPRPDDRPPLPTDEEAAKGDKIVLKSGTALDGVQVVRATPMVVVFQIVPGVEPMEIPRKMVAEIVYDDLGPGDVKLMSEQLEEEQAPGEQGEIKPELAEKLGKTLTPTLMQINGDNVLEVLQRFATQLEVPLEIDPAVRSLPAIELEWQTQVGPKLAFVRLLREKLPREIPKLKANIAYDRVQIQLAEGGGPPL